MRIDVAGVRSRGPTRTSHSFDDLASSQSRRRGRRCRPWMKYLCIAILTLCLAGAAWWLNAGQEIVSDVAILTDSEAAGEAAATGLVAPLQSDPRHMEAAIPQLKPASQQRISTHVDTVALQAPSAQTRHTRVAARTNHKKQSRSPYDVLVAQGKRLAAIGFTGESKATEKMPKMFRVPPNMQTCVLPPLSEWGKASAEPSQPSELNVEEYRGNVEEPGNGYVPSRPARDPLKDEEERRRMALLRAHANAAPLVAEDRDMTLKRPDLAVPQGLHSLHKEQPAMTLEGEMPDVHIPRQRPPGGVVPGPFQRRPQPIVDTPSRVAAKRRENPVHDARSNDLIRMGLQGAEPWKPATGARRLLSDATDTKQKCNALFGTSGYDKVVTMCNVDSNNKRTRALQSVAECRRNGGTGGVACSFTNLLMDPHKITVSKGGEPVSSVLGRGEQAEFPSYQHGALTLTCRDAGSGAQRWPNHLEKMIGAVRYQPAPDQLPKDQYSDLCYAGNPNPDLQWVNEPTLLVTRYEYCNLYHTMTEWYNAFQAHAIFRDEISTSFSHAFRSRLGPQQQQTTDQSNRPLFLLMDGHAAGLLDEPWLKLFRPVTLAQTTADGLPYVANLKKKTCFRHAILSAPGYTSSLFVNQMQEWTLACAGHQFLAEFSTTFLKAYGLDSNRKPTENSDGITHVHLNILIVLRKGYVAHPRIGSRAKHAARTIMNPVELIGQIQALDIDSGSPSVKVHTNTIAVFFEDLSFAHQMKMVYDADVMIGMHGAGLSHVMFMRPESLLLELTASAYASRFHFRYFSQWMGMMYKVLSVSGSGEEFTVDSGRIANELKPLLCTVLSRKVTRNRLSFT